MSESRKEKGRTRPTTGRIPLGLEQLESRVLLSAPVIQSFSDSPDPVHEGNTVTLTASDVIDPDPGDNVIEVEFYRSTDAAFDPGFDTLLGNDTNGVDGWDWQGAADWGAGLWYYFARAQDDNGEWSSGILTTGTVNALPVVGSLTGDPQAVTYGDTLTLTAEGVSTSPGANFPLHLHPVFHEADVYGDGAPTAVALTGRDTRQGPGSLPVSEAVPERVFKVPWFKRHRPEAIRPYADAIRKVAENADRLREDDGR